MREEGKAIQDTNAARCLEERKPYDEWHANLTAATDAWIQSNGYDPEELKGRMYSSGRILYSVEEIDFLD